MNQFLNMLPTVSLIAIEIFIFQYLPLVWTIRETGLMMLIFNRDETKWTKAAAEETRDRNEEPKKTTKPDLLPHTIITAQYNFLVPLSWFTIKHWRRDVHFFQNYRFSVNIKVKNSSFSNNSEKKYKFQGPGQWNMWILKSVKCIQVKKVNIENKELFALQSDFLQKNLSIQNAYNKNGMVEARPHNALRYYFRKYSFSHNI